MLWAINRMIFHPRGYAMFVELDDDGLATGWGIYGDGSEVWTFSTESDDEKFEMFNEFMEKITKQNNKPPE